MRIAALAGILLAVGACGSDSTSPTSLAGTYNLTTVNGKALPFTWDSTSTTHVYKETSATLTMNANGTWSVLDKNSYLNGTTTTTDAITFTGTWTLSGSTVTIVEPAGQPCGTGCTTTTSFTLTGTVSGNNITTVSGGETDVWVKQ